jgi:hypothetical protein
VWAWVIRSSKGSRVCGEVAQCKVPPVKRTLRLRNGLAT